MENNATPSRPNTASRNSHDRSQSYWEDGKCIDSSYFITLDPSAPQNSASRTLIRANAGRYIWQCRKARSKKELEEAKRKAKNEKLRTPNNTRSAENKSSAPESKAVAGYSYLLGSKRSPFGDIADKHTRRVVVHDLLRIYHDCLENVLSCVLTERNCPYSNYFSRRVQGLQAIPLFSIEKQWGPRWSNRICSQVCRLDRAYSAVRGRNLTETEEQAVSKALHASIMAFAMQWRKDQSFQHQAGGIPASSPKSGQVPSTILKDYWNDALHALRQSIDIESMRVALACIVFSLIKRNDFQLSESLGNPSTETVGPGPFQDTGTAGIEVLQTLLDSDEGPQFLESGVRMMFVSRYKVKRLQHAELAKARAQMDSKEGIPEKTEHTPDHVTDHSKSIILNDEESETFHMLYWFGIIMDTIKAAIHNRPVVVSDKDTAVSLEVPRAVGSSGHTSFNQPAHSLWKELLFYSGSLRETESVPLWPCSYEQAAGIICDAAPVKLLLFRRLTQLQSLLYQVAEAEQLEEAIENTNRLLHFWDQTYGQFMKGCAAYHGTLPPRLQTWYVIIDGHWHLGVLLFSNILDEIDNAHLGLDHKRDWRQSIGYMTHLKHEHAFSASEIACLCLWEGSSFLSQGHQFDELFQDAIILTEPWLDLHFRLFSLAALTFLNEINQQQVYSLEDISPFKILVEDMRQRCIYCIGALRCLGKASDVADLAARILSKSLQEVVGLQYQRSSNVDIGWSDFVDEYDPLSLTL